MLAGVYAVQGAWWPLLAVHLQDLGIPGRMRGLIFGTLALSSLLTPLAVGHLADRRVAAERLFTVIFALGSGLLLVLASGAVHGSWALFLLFLAYWLITAPGFSIASTIALRNVPNPSTDFGKVRLWGTVGWMGVGWLVSIVMFARGTGGNGHGTYEAFAIAALISASMSFFAIFALPHTPPLSAPGIDRSRFAFADIFRVISRPTVGLALALAFGANVTSPFVYQVVPAYLRALGLDRAWVGSAMSLSQVLEIVVLLVLTRLLSRFGFRIVLTCGLLAWACYHGIMALHPPLWLAIVTLPVQGLAIACFQITMLMYLDAQSPSDLRASTQALYVTMTSGLGSLVGSLLAGESVARAGGVTEDVFRAPFLINGCLLFLFVLFFRPRQADAVVPNTAAEDLTCGVRPTNAPTLPSRSAPPRRRKRVASVR